MTSARDEILGKLKNAVHPEPDKPDFDGPVYFPIKEPLEQAFKENLEKVNGIVHLFSSEKDLYDSLKKSLSIYNSENIICKESQIQNKLDEFEISINNDSEIPESIEVGITSCEFLIAHTGSVMVSSAQEGGRQLFIYPPVHIIIAKANQVVDYLEAAYAGIQNKYGKNLPSQITLITGPSRTADIEKTLVMGAHGPKEVHVFISE